MTVNDWLVALVAVVMLVGMGFALGWVCAEEHWRQRERDVIDERLRYRERCLR